ncbi:hypothetical protein BC936DRAFT_149787 [Jimgerdemannia flammicorona]|uniref:Uncharacterized protein n=1 Tax=Jimgerdemannia flammicorona TaxID=994334 RepID=A0A433D049_9FUNG|nr:hypothetical protein BC936DRAFT_149787 [Jimgerdemannia flammicorona]
MLLNNHIALFVTFLFLTLLAPIVHPSPIKKRAPSGFKVKLNPQDGIVHRLEKRAANGTEWYKKDMVVFLCSVERTDGVEERAIVKNATGLRNKDYKYSHNHKHPKRKLRFLCKPEIKGLDA